MATENKIKYFENREDWRKWLMDNFETEDEIWFVFPRFTPRKPKSTYSQANKERLKWLLANKMIHPEFEDKIRTVLSDPFIFPNDIMDRLKEDEIAWRNYRHFSDAYKRIRIAYIEAARKRPEEFEKRLNNFICKVKENKMITGFGGIEKYY
ncbi:YdeI/OmpD-associated family protein [Bacteroides thetaiotaomicron]|uniref:YdeI/OmpD-associated family protein n=1 Tax=Bacteroides thetaiotaomicron TaxID=818 RepID=UPI001C382B18|nr:YdeI/OmpD-associated family protein [Bacteroides thetaiotaomicron]MBV4237054.1 YdeI/OmpD-associated family protein [Bacteroides thetaiotaomicron]MBV4253347.1 YdeI/OmpD-associated family protein [Bacteroides thetaiotaomicron]MBV4272233.1 YdeI/OmpD-associated family protein [Bacteroides thetaiotaomicron]